MAFRKTVEEIKSTMTVASEKVAEGAKNGTTQIVAAIILSAIILALGMIIAAAMTAGG